VDRDSFLAAARSQAELAIQHDEALDAGYLECVEKVAREVALEGRVYAKYLQDVLNRARERYNPKCQESSGVTAVTGEVVFQSGMADVTRLALLREIDLEVRQLRAQLFGPEDPPFSLYEHAVSWIEEQLAAVSFPSGEEAIMEYELRELIYMIADQIERDHGTQVFIDWGNPVFRYRPDDPMGYYVDKDSPLRDLAIASIQLARRTRFREEDLVRYVLTNEKPSLPRIEATVDGSGLFGRSHGGLRINIRLNAPDVTHKEIIEALQQIRLNRKGLTDPGWILFAELIEEFGEPPERKRGASGEYWRKLRDAWNEKAEAFGLEKVGTLEALMNRWGRRPEELR